jgi:hypothetical protein
MNIGGLIVPGYVKTVARPGADTLGTASGAAADIGAQATGNATRQLEQRAHTGGVAQDAMTCTTLEAELGRLTPVQYALAEEVVL